MGGPNYSRYGVNRRPYKSTARRRKPLDPKRSMTLEKFAEMGEEEMREALLKIDEMEGRLLTPGEREEMRRAMSEPPERPMSQEHKAALEKTLEHEEMLGRVSTRLMLNKDDVIEKGTFERAKIEERKARIYEITEMAHRVGNRLKLPSSEVERIVKLALLYPEKRAELERLNDRLGRH